MKHIGDVDTCLLLPSPLARLPKHIFSREPSFYTAAYERCKQHWSLEVKRPQSIQYCWLTHREASGLLGRQVQQEFLLDGWKSVGTGLSRIASPDVIKLNILNKKEIETVLEDAKPDVVVHCAANRFPDSCTANPDAARKLNVDSSRALAEATTSRGIFLIYISTDYVFPGRPGEAPYKVASTPSPPNM